MNRVLWITFTLLLSAACAPLPDEEPSLSTVEQPLADFSKTLNVHQGFNFHSDKQVRVGFLNSLTIGGYTLAADLTTIRDPEAPAPAFDTSNAAVLRSISWDTARTGTIQLAGQISTANRQQLTELLQGTLSDTSVDFVFSVYEHDARRNAYVKTAYATEPLRGQIEQTASALNIAVADDPSTEVLSPQNYQFTMSIKPQAVEQEIHVLVGGSRYQVKRWGISEKAAK